MKTFAAYWPSSQAVRWRTLSWKEYEHFRRLQQQHPASSMEVYLPLYRAVCIEGPPPEEVTAGIVDYIGEFCFENNPFSGRYEDLAGALSIKRGSLDYLGHARALIAGLFKYTFEEIDTWDADMFFERLAQAEFLSGKPLEPLDPNAEQSGPTPGKSSNGPPKLPKKNLTQGQQLVMERVQQRKSSQ